MAKSKVAPAARIPQPATRSDAPQVIPLEAVSITWTRGRHFFSEGGDVRLEISGGQLGQILGLAVDHPARVARADR